MKISDAVDKLRARKVLLEQRLFQLIREFEQETGLQVKTVQVRYDAHARTLDGEIPIEVEFKL